MIQIVASLKCDGNRGGGWCSEVIHYRTVSEFLASGAAYLRRTAADRGWTKAKVRDQKWYSDFCPECSAARKADRS